MTRPRGRIPTERGPWGGWPCIELLIAGSILAYLMVMGISRL